LDKLGGPREAESSQIAHGAALKAFRSGMRAGAHAPYARWDPETASWESHLKHDFDLFLVLANDSQDDLATSLNQVESILQTTGAVRVEVERGRKSAREADLENGGVDPVEHFGFADGIAGPVFFKHEADQLAHRQFNPAQNLDTVLWPENSPDGSPSFGSFLAVMKLEQNVRAFRQRASELKTVLGLRSSDQAEALAVGRYKDGTPLVPTASPDRDDFNYDNDPLIGSGAKLCPASAHMRRMNRRAKTSPLVIARRGFHYGESWEVGRNPTPPKAGVGLMFLGFSASLHSFISLMGATQGPACAFQGGVDALIGQSQPAPAGNQSCDGRQRWWHAGDRNWVDFRMADFVTQRGGEYFFVPSLHFLERLKNQSGTGNT